MSWRKRRLPYRGDDLPRHEKPLKRIVNLRKLKLLVARDVLIFIIPMVAWTIHIIWSALTTGNISGDYLFVHSIVWAIVLVIVFGIIDLTKFREDRDVDVSWEDNDIDNENTEQ